MIMGFRVKEQRNRIRPRELWMFTVLLAGILITLPGRDARAYFEDSGQTLGSSGSIGVALGDVDGDGDLDAFVVNSFNEANIVWLNDGDGVFTDSGQSLGSRASYGVTLGTWTGTGTWTPLLRILMKPTLSGSTTGTECSRTAGSHWAIRRA